MKVFVLLAFFAGRGSCVSLGDLLRAASVKPHAFFTPVVQPQIKDDRAQWHPLFSNVLWENDYTFVQTLPSVAGDRNDALKCAVVAEGSRASWERLCASFEFRYGPFDDHAPTDDHHVIGWFARCPEDLERSDLVEELAHARNEHRGSKQVVACVFFPDPLDDHDDGALDPFFLPRLYGKDAHRSFAMKPAVDEHSVFVFYVSEYWFRDRQGQNLLKKLDEDLATAETALAEKDDDLATAETALAEKDDDLAASETNPTTLETDLAAEKQRREAAEREAAALRVKLEEIRAGAGTTNGAE
eukprot:CAMPEP_0118893628 /NCGR_PEP_ID=MMETSP1166-20130328/2759_1 /TAXON_ID=1104430 /ORGANISM="Chrysoreinhardia sp, Strain CCMP3193" /LENGTH=299 /DNA_ID=CAMNT_0006832457 /DNA_START=94 /DNA_END=993 /DNA_ORIENTATION=+